MMPMASSLHAMPPRGKQQQSPVGVWSLERTLADSCASRGRDQVAHDAIPLRCLRARAVVEELYNDCGDVAGGLCSGDVAVLPGGIWVDVVQNRP